MAAAKEEKAGAGAAPSQDPAGIKTVGIPTCKVVTGTVFYQIAVTNASNKWGVSKRYSQFEELHMAVTTEMGGKSLPAGTELPPKRMKLFTTHTDPEFIEQRRCLLEAYLKKLLSVDKLAKGEALGRFFDSDKDATMESTSIEEKKKAEPPEDVEITGVSIPATRTMSDHILYQNDVTNNRKRKTYSKWTVLKRFGQFYDMDTQVRADFAEQPSVLTSMPAPPERKAKLLSDHMDETFVEQRRVLLENYLQRMVDNPHVVKNKHFLTFLGVTVDGEDEEKQPEQN